MVFDRDDKRRSIVHGNVKAVLTLVCQRCLEPMEYPVDTEFNLALVRGFQEAERLPEEFDPLLLEDEQPVAVRELIEDELLLAIPDVPRHGDDRACEIKERPEVVEAVETTPIERQVSSDNPFAVLASLKRQGSESDSEI